MKALAAHLVDIEQAIAWLQGHGAPVGDRIEVYRATIAGALAAKSKEEHPPLKELFAALCEANDLAEIAALPDDIVARHRDKLRVVATGRDFYADVLAGEQDQGRDAVFELVVADLWARSGVRATLEEPADVCVHSDDYARHALIECKRPKTANGVERSIVDACRQLARHRAAGQDGPGIIALDLTRLANPEMGVMHGATDQEVSLGMDGAAVRFLDAVAPRIQDAWYHADNGAMVDFMMFRIIGMTCVANRYKIGVIWRLSAPPADPDGRLTWFMELVTRLPGFNPRLLDYGR